MITRTHLRWLSGSDAPAARHDDARRRRRPAQGAGRWPPSGHPNADRYQLLAHCITLGLGGTGHLVCARGNEEPAVYRVADANVVVQAHALDLDRGRVERTTISNPPHPAKPLDLVDRTFRPLAPDRLWVAAFTYMSRRGRVGATPRSSSTPTPAGSWAGRSPRR